MVQHWGCNRTSVQKTASTSIRNLEGDLLPALSWYCIIHVELCAKAAEVGGDLGLRRRRGSRTRQEGWGGRVVWGNLTRGSATHVRVCVKACGRLVWLCVGHATF